MLRWKTIKKKTVLVAANMTGTEKLPLFVLGHSKQPRCFKNVKKLPVDYDAIKKALMTSELFENGLRKVDAKFNMEG